MTRKRKETMDELVARLMAEFAEEQRIREASMTPDELAAEEARRRAMLEHTLDNVDDEDFKDPVVLTKSGWQRRND